MKKIMDIGTLKTYAKTTNNSSVKDREEIKGRRKTLSCRMIKERLLAMI